VKNFIKEIIFKNYSINGVQQNKISDCFLLAPICAIMKSDPNYFKEKVIEVFSDHIEVNLYKPNYDEFFNITYTPTKILLPLELHGTDTCAPWVQIIEMAYAKLRPTEFIDMLNTNKKGLEYLSSGFLEHAPGVLTGQRTVNFDLKNDKENQNWVFEMLQLGIENKKNFTVSFVADYNILQKHKIYTSHLYALIGYSIEEDGRRVKLINPHGNKDVIYMKLEDFFECVPCVNMDTECAGIYYQHITNKKINAEKIEKKLD